MSIKLVRDGSILWLQTDKIGTPDVWEAGKNYHLGDVIVPTNPSPELANFMFQCVGFLGKSGSVIPLFTNQEEALTIDGTIEWETIDKKKSPKKLEVDEFFIIEQETTVN